MWHVTRDMCHVTRDMCHVTRDTWHVTRDTWHVTRLGVWTFSQNFSSLALTVCDLGYYEDLEEKAHGLNEWINDKAVYRTAPATPGLLNIAKASPISAQPVSCLVESISRNVRLCVLVSVPFYLYPEMCEMETVGESPKS